MNNPHFLLTSDHVLTICSSVNRQDNQIQALLSTTSNTVLPLHRLRSAKPFIRYKNEQQGYFCSIIIRAFAMVTDLLRFIHLVMFCYQWWTQLATPFSQSLCKQLCAERNQDLSLRLVSTQSLWASPGTAAMAGAWWLRTTSTTHSRYLSEHLGDTTYFLWHRHKMCRWGPGDMV